MAAASIKQDEPAGDQQRQHRLAHDLEDDPERRPATGRGLVVTLGGQSRLCFCFAQPGKSGWRIGDVIHY